MVKTIKRIRHKYIGKYWVVQLIETIPNKLYWFKFHDLRNEIVYDPKLEMSADDVLEMYNSIKTVKHIQERIVFINGRKPKARELFPIK
ncbi:MAG: hypothetical protein ACFFG0_20805 [Candidatus Thorarchaeota archaeon]